MCGNYVLLLLGYVRLSNMLHSFVFLNRQTYKRLLSYLAEAGQNEIQKLENETGSQCAGD